MRPNTHIYDSSTWEAKDGASWVQGLLGYIVHSETLTNKSSSLNSNSSSNSNGHNSHTNFLNFST